MAPLSESALALVAALGWCAVLVGAGARLRGWARLATPDAFALAANLLAGAWLAAVLALGAGLVGAFRPASLLAIAVLMLAIGRHRWRRDRGAALAFLPAAVVLVPFALAAPFWHDALTYQLALPWQALLEGRLAPHPENVFAAFPPLAQLLAAFPLAAGLERAPALVHLASFAAAGAVVRGLAVRLGAPPAHALAAAAVLPFLPAHVLVPALPAAEGFTLLGILLALALALGEAGGSHHRGTWFLAGFAAGVAVAARLQGVGWSALAFGLVALGARGRPRALLAATVGWLAGALPWWLKNAVLLGEPWAPIGWRREGMETLWRDSHSGLALGLGPRELLVSLGPALAPHAGWLLPLVLAAALGSLGPPRRERLRLAVVAALGVALWSATGQLPRFLAPSAALLLVLAASAPAPAPTSGSGSARIASSLALSITALLGVALTVSEARRWGSPGLVLEPAAATRARHLFADPFPAFAAATRLPSAARVLFVGEDRGYGFPRAFVAGSQHDPPVLRDVLESSSDAGAARAALVARGFSHLLVNTGELARLSGGYPVVPFATEAGRERFRALVEQISPPVVAEGPVAIFALGDRGAARGGQP